MHQPKLLTSWKDFISICTYHRQHLFGDIRNGEMILNEFGQIAWNEWFRTAELRKNIILDEFVVMPNHIHGIIIIDGRGVLHTPVSNNMHTPVSNNVGTPISDNVGTPIFDNVGTVDAPGNAGVCNTLGNKGVCNTPLRSPSQTIGAIVRGYNVGNKTNRSIVY